MNTITQTKPANYTDRGGSVRQNVFIVATQDRTLVIQCHNVEQRRIWIETIEYYSQHPEQD